MVSQVNDCEYCLAAHTVLGRMSGFTDEQIVELRGGRAFFDAKLDALAAFVRETTDRRGKPSAATTERLFSAGFTEENVVDVVVTIGDKFITNFLHGVTRVAVDFPAAAPLAEVGSTACATSCGSGH